MDFSGTRGPSATDRVGPLSSRFASPLGSWIDTLMNRSSALVRRIALLGGLGAALAALAIPDTARACSCEPWVDIQAPLDGSTHPSNGLLVIDAQCGGDPATLKVFVDGQPASLLPEHNRMVGLGYEISPEPEPGAVVEIIGCPGYASCDEAREVGGVNDEDELPFGAVEMSFTVGERDETAPVAPVMGGLDYVLEDVEEFCSYEGGTRPAREWSFTLDGQTDEPVLYHVTLGPAGSDDPTRTRRVVLDGDDDLELTLRRFAEDAGHEVCATVRTFDLTGNEADSVSTCAELGRRETLQDEGCACSAGGPPGGMGGAALMLLLGGWARRRPRRR